MILLAAALSTCMLIAAGDEWKGKCGPFEGETPLITFKRAAAITSGAYRKDVRPREVFAGDSDLPDDHHQPVELEL